MIEIDGRTEEGGGQILRTSLALSVLTGQPLRIRHIRANRNPPGLKPQHLAAVHVARLLSGASCEGDRPGSPELIFQPSHQAAGEHHVDVGTAGSVTLLMQVALLPCLLAERPVRLSLVGGTDVPWAPPVDYLRWVILPPYERLGRVEVDVPRRGFYPRGGGRLEVGFYPEPGRAPLDLVESTPMESVRGRAVASKQLAARRVAERLAEAVEGDVEVEYADSASPGCAITLWGECPGVRRGADALGKKDLSAEEVGARAARMLRERLEARAPVDEHLADNLVPLLAVVGGAFEAQVISPHTRANMYVVESFLGKRFAVEGKRISW